LKLPLAILLSTLTGGKPLQTGTKELKAIFFVNKDVIKRGRGRLKLRFKCKPTNPEKRDSVAVHSHIFLGWILFKQRWLILICFANEFVWG